MEPNKTISLVIRVRNAAGDLERCLGEIRQQTLPPGHELEIIVVDNESEDDSAKVAQQYGSCVVFLAANDFSWGRALNVGISQSAGDIVLILSADAYPADENWIIEMIKPFVNPKVAAVYGRQKPRSNAPIDEIVRLKKTFRKTTIIVKSLPKNFSSKGGQIPVSNACAAIRKNIWETEPYDEDIAGAEDALWTYRILKKKYYVVYQSSACVFHSHNDPLFREAWRNLELIKKNVELSGKNLSCSDYIKHILSFSKRRLYNSISPGIQTTSRINGFLILPIELVCFCITTFFFHNQKTSSKYRSFFWNK